MPALRARVYTATGIFVGLQVAATFVGLSSWWQVRGACQRQLQLEAERAEVLELGSAIREVYVHQAHTFIDGDAGHLGHLDEGMAAVEGDLQRVEGLSISDDADLARVRELLADNAAWFARSVEPLARAGTLDRTAAVALHAEAERRSAAAEDAVGRVLSAVAAQQDAEVATIARRTAYAWTAVAVLTLAGIAAGLGVASRLVAAVLGPVEALRGAARAFAAGRPAAAREDGDEELAELGRAFNAMVAQVHAAERRRLDVERLAALGEMSGAVAHELLNPLTVILGHPALKQAELGPVRAEAEHARRVVQGLLGFARPGEEPPEPVDLVQAARQSVRRLAFAADEADVTLEVTGAGGPTLVAPPSAVRQVLDNLVQNAIQASPPAGRVEVDVGPGPVVEVRDRGAGIPDPVRPRLYEPFVTGRHHGTGLGLAISQRIVRALDGVLTHRDREGGGTVAVWQVRRG